MTVHNIDIFRPEWLNVVFADRNQAYGAYQLRRDNARTTCMALLIALSSFVLLMAAPTIIGKMRGVKPDTTDKTTYVIQKVDNTVYKIIPPKTQPNSSHPTAPPVNDVVKYTAYVPTNAPVADPPTDAQIAKADIGQTTMTGTHAEGPAIVDVAPGPVTTAGSGTGTGPATGEPSNEIFKAAEVSPEYPGGEAAFGKFLQKNIRYPQIAKENGIQGRAYLQFIVERDGSLTGIQIVRNPGGGTGEEAERVLKMSPHWKPGRQNGTNVRVQFTIPVNFSLGDQN